MEWAGMGATKAEATEQTKRRDPLAKNHFAQSHYSTAPKRKKGKPDVFVASADLSVRLMKLEKEAGV